MRLGRRQNGKKRKRSLYKEINIRKRVLRILIINNGKKRVKEGGAVRKGSEI